jgi:hypothetical protein
VDGDQRDRAGREGLGDVGLDEGAADRGDGREDAGEGGGQPVAHGRAVGGSGGVDAVRVGAPAAPGRLHQRTDEAGVVGGVAAGDRVPLAVQPVRVGDQEPLAVGDGVQAGQVPHGPTIGAGTGHVQDDHQGQTRGRAVPGGRVEQEPPSLAVHGQGQPVVAAAERPGPGGGRRRGRPGGGRRGRGAGAGRRAAPGLATAGNHGDGDQRCGEDATVRAPSHRRAPGWGSDPVTLPPTAARRLRVRCGGRQAASDRQAAGKPLPARVLDGQLPIL